jgi:glucan biosynthesis protein C
LQEGVTVKPMPPVEGGARIFYLDALRAFCMLYGILNHGSNIWRSAPGEGPVVISMASDLFRMATFFLLAGFFTAMAASRMDARTYAASRFDVLVVPLATSLAVLAPITNWLIHRFHSGPMALTTYLFEGGWRQPTIGEEVWHLHFWFLFCLILFAALTPALLRIARLPLVTGGLDRLIARFGRFSIWAVVILLGLLSVALTGVHKIVVEPFTGDTPFAWIVRATFAYMPVYIIGVAAFVHRGLFEALHRVSIPGLIGFGLAYFWIPGAQDLLPFAVWGALQSFVRIATLVMVVAALLTLFRRHLGAPSPLLATLIASAYTFYLLHFTMIYLIANAMQPFTDNRWLMYAVIVLLGAPLCVLVHTRLVAPSPTLRYLLNGRRTVPRTAPASS